MSADASLRAPARFWIAAAPLAVVALTAGILLAMGRNLICTCGTVKLWAGSVNSADNSQHIADWYVPSHIVHGILFYAVLHWLFARGWIGWPVRVRFLAAVILEAAWEVLENTPMIIDRYRNATAAVGYTGDSVLNSVADIGWMSLGFWLAYRLPLAAIVLLAIALELLALFVIRDNLTLNVLMLVYPIAAIRQWQAAL